MLRDRGSYTVRIFSAEAAMSDRALTAVMNVSIFDYEGAPLRDLVLRTEGDLLVQEGILHKVIDIPFTISAELTTTDDGDLRIHPVSMKICGLPGEGLMKALGIEMEDLLDLSQAVGVRVEGNDLILDPEKMLPPPAIEGKVREVRIEGDRVVLTFGPPPDENPQVAGWPEPPDPAAENFQFLYGGVVRFGQLFMVGTDMAAWRSSCPTTPRSASRSSLPRCCRWSDRERGRARPPSATYARLVEWTSSGRCARWVMKVLAMKDDPEIAELPKPTRSPAPPVE